MPYIETDDGTELYVKDWGTGRPVILIHGWPLSADSWDDHARILAENGYRAISYDRRGFGRSEQPWTGYDYDTLADDLAAVMEAAEVEDATLVGFSMGGGEVARYMSRHGGKGVRQVALIAAVTPYLLQTPDNPDGVPQATLDQIRDGILEDRAGFFEGFFKDFYGVGFFEKPVSQGVLDWSSHTMFFAGLKPILACAESFGTTDFRPDMAAINVPALILHGTADKTVPIDAAARQAAQLIPQARLIEYDGAPHGLLATHKAEVARDLLAFLAG